MITNGVTQMFLNISSRGEDVFTRRLAPYEPLDCDYYARRYANSVDATITPSHQYIPDDCGDIRVEIRQQKNNSTVIHASSEYYLEFHS